jgi:hypothetical protein
MKFPGIVLAAGLSIFLSACGSSGGTAPGSPTAVSVTTGATNTEAVVSFTAPVSAGTSAVTGYTVTVAPGGITASGTSSPITVTGLTRATAYTFSVVATSADGSSAPATTGALRFYSVVETFTEPSMMLATHTTVFDGTFTYDVTHKVVSNLRGTLTEVMTGAVPTKLTLAHQLSSEPVTVDGVDGELVTTFMLDTVNTFDPYGFAPGLTTYYGHGAGAPNPNPSGVGNAYAMIFVNTAAGPATTPGPNQIAVLAYADCAAGGMMGDMCMTGTTAAVYGRVGTMGGFPSDQVVTER